MKKQLFGAFACLFYCLSASLSAGDFTTDLQQWQATVTGDAYDLDLTSLQKADGTNLSGDEFFNNVIPNNQDLGWGTISQANVDPEGLVVFTQNGFVFTTPLRGRPVSHNLDASLGQLNGFNFRYGDFAADVRIYDGDTLVDSFTTVFGQTDVENGASTHICWENTDGVNVTRIELEPAASVDPTNPNVLLAVLEGEFRFASEPETLTCFEQLEIVKTGVDELIEDASYWDAYWLEGASDCIAWMRQDCFWEQPSGNRLSGYGGSMFIGATYAVYYLERVDDPMADVLIDEMLDVLECIVDHEIAYAIENGGNQCYIENAEAYAELGNIIDEDFDNQVIATLAFRLAWLHAYYATY